MQGEPFSSSSTFFLYSVLLTLVLLLLDRHAEKKEQNGYDVLNDARHLIHGAAPTVCGRVQEAGPGAAGPDAAARQGAQGP